jgi:hypothetical protein
LSTKHQELTAKTPFFPPFDAVYIFTECALCFDRTSWEDGSVEHGYVCTPVAKKDADYEEESFKDCVHHEGIVLV